MSKRTVVVGGATVAAGLVLGASIVFGPPAGKSEDPKFTGGVGAPSADGTPADSADGLAANVRRFDYTTFEEGGDGQLRRMRLRAVRANLKPMGVTELLGPRAEINLGTQKAITITADKADMVMESNTPRAGQFSGNVVVTLFQAPAGTKLVIDPEDAAHKQFIQQRIFLDDATSFSIEDDTIDTRGPVHVTSPQVDFFGQGLRLAYNTQRQRIEQLVVSEGRYLIFNPEAQAPAFEDEQQADNADAEPRSDEASSPPAPSQFYLATFQDQVVVRDGIESELGGDELRIDFSLGTEAVSFMPIQPAPQNGQGQSRLTPSTGLPAMLAIPGGRLAQVEQTWENEEPTKPQAADDTPLDDNLALPVVEIPQQNAARSLFSYDVERDIVVTWTGPMHVSPLPKKPELLADDEDVLVTLLGTDAYAQTTRSGELERLDTIQLEYLLSQERTTALGHDGRPVRIVSEGLGGVITGERLIVRQQDGTATIFGPGQIDYTSDEDGKRLTLTWRHRLDLELFTVAQTDEKGRTQTKIVGVKTATFDAAVTARHPDFDLDADRLTLTFLEPDELLGVKNSPSSINASGNIVVHARGDAEDERFTIRAGRLTIDLKPDGDGDAYATAMRALDNVRIERPGSTLACNRVEVALNPPDTAVDPDKPYAQVSTILAIGNVRAELDYDGQRVDLAADQLVGDVERDRLTLSSNNPRRPAEVVDITDDRKITGEVIVMDDRAEVLVITGAGSLLTKLDDPENPDAGVEDAYLNVTWAASMRFNNVTGEAEFVEQVRSESRRSTDSSELVCDKLEMLFSPAYEHDPARLVDDQGKDAHERQVRSAVASGSVRFIAAAWDPFKDEHITNRVRIEGPKLVFTNKPAIEVGATPVESVVVEGAGLLVLEDYRPPDEKATEAEAGNERESVTMTGRGATLFEWERSMTLDARTNTATFLDAVAMIHQEKDESGANVGTPIQLEAGRLVADMTDTGGLSVWVRDDAPDARLSVVTADDDVRIIHAGRSIHMQADHLRFTDATQLVELWPDAGRDVVLTDQQRDTMTRTNKITWDLAKDRIEIDELRGGSAPLE